MKNILRIAISSVVLFSSCNSLTKPDELLNQKASLPENFKLSDKQQNVITTFINNRTHTTSILYGNSKALLAAGKSGLNRTPGEAFTLVTWRQQDDTHWFGARIPGDLLSAETLELSDINNKISYHYQKFEGKDLTKLADTTGNADRIKFITSQKASIIP